MRLAALISKF